MTIEDVKITIKNHILNSISHRDLCVLCNIFEIPTTGRRGQIQKRLIDSILVATNVDLLHRILYMINRSVNRDTNGQIISSQTRDAVQTFVQNGNINSVEVDRTIGYQMNGYNQRNVIATLNSKLYCISNEMLDKCPINLRPEIIIGVDPLNIFIPNYTKYPSGYFSAPSTSPTLLNGRVNIPNVQLPYCVKNTVILSSQFYCCQVVLHPLCLLIPKPTPNICQPTRVMSKMQLQFTLSNNARHLITAHRTQVNNKRIYKWQVLIRFGMYDPSKPFPNSSEHVTNLPEYIPPYLTLFVNNVPVPLWDILPSNAPAKEGKRHPRPINISDHLKFSSADEQGYRQSINVNWWQTPGVYQYYYFAVYLERKLAVDELFNRFVNKTHHIQMPISFTINLIREKFSNNNQFKKKIDENGDEDDDDLVISSVLPISLLCPVGKSRITCPIRGVHCQHLQCFDAHLYLMMNERRSVWKCPVCDAQATLNELFVDEFFLKILQEFSNNEDITEVNVNPDGSYVPVAVKESREHKQHIGNIISNVETKEKNVEEKQSPESSDSSENHPVILLESDDDDESNFDQLKGSPKKSISVQSLTSAVNSSNSVDSTQIQNSTTKTINPSLTIDLTSDSEEETKSPPQDVRYNVSMSSNLPTSSNNPPVSSQPFSQIFSHNSQPMHQQISHQQIAPKLPSSNFMKLSESSQININTLNYHPSSSNEAISIPNPYQSVLNNSMPSQSINKLPYLWMSQNQRFPQNRTNDLVNCFMPQLKPCFPTQNFVNMVHQPNNFTGMEASPSGSTPLLPRPIKTDPHLNLCIRFKESKSYNNPVYNNKVTNTSERKQKSETNKSPSTRNQSRRSTRILNQHRKIYKEKSISEDDGDDSDDSDESEILGIGRNKRKNAFDDSTSSNSSVSNRKRRRLIPDASSDEENSNKERLVHQSDIMTTLKCPLVILNKLDPVVLKVYLQQNEVSYDVSDEGLSDSAFPEPNTLTVINDSGIQEEPKSNITCSGI